MFFSVIIPTYNRAGLISAAIESVLCQTFGDYELIIADDGSIDDTRAVVAKYQSDSRVYYYSQKNKGVCAARNLGALNSKGKYLVFLDSDDFVEVNWLLDFHAVLQNEKAAVAFCNMKIRQNSGAYKMVDSTDPYGNNSTRGMYIAGLFTVRRELFIEVGMYDEKMKFGENTELGYRLRAMDLVTTFVPNYNVTYSPSAEGGSKNLFNKLYSNLYILKKHSAYFSKHKRSQKLFMKVAAVAAIRLGKYQLGRKLLHDTWKADKADAKSFLQYMLSLDKRIARMKWKPIQPK